MMDSRLRHAGMTATTLTRRWRIVMTPPMAGAENMAYDLATLDKVARGEDSPTLRFFRWSRPTLSYGRLQRWDCIRGLVPRGWDAVQRPTGGGVVFHDQDCCFSLAWKNGEAPLPRKIKDVYPWIHGVVQKALAPWLTLQLATCRDCRTPPPSFQERQCFETPVAFDLLKGTKKIVGGALGRQREGFLYQGTIHEKLGGAALQTLADAFERGFDG